MEILSLLGMFLFFGALFSVVPMFVWAVVRYDPRRTYYERLPYTDEVDYLEASREASEHWRWREPVGELSFRVDNKPERSILHIPNEMWPSDYQFVPGGFLMLASFVVLVALVCSRIALGEATALDVMGVVFLLPCMLFFSFAMLFSDKRLIRVELSPESVTFVQRFGLGLLQIHTYPRDEKQSWVGFLQVGWFGWKRYRVQGLRRKRWLPWRRRFFDASISRTCSHGTWLVGGLNAWNDSPERMEG